MAGVYVHIPFCKQACTYCDFHFSTTFATYRDEMVEAIIQEVSQRSDYLEGEQVETIYFGGGTPSLLTGDEVAGILKSVCNTHNCVEELEITLEANPDDITDDKLVAWKAAGINRLSIGIQSFDDADLKWMNRAHNADESLSSVQRALKHGFRVTIDLIYGLPNVSNTQWRRNLEIATQLQPQHISAYCLTIEENTVLDNWTKNGKIEKVPSEKQAEQFDILVDFLEQMGYEQYEISNFAKDSNYAQHNSNYWRGRKYLGIGPSAHSFNGVSRAWNIANNQRYLRAINHRETYVEEEVLSQNDRFNELLMTGLRTKWGVDLDVLSTISEINKDFYLYVEKRIESGEMVQRRNHILLTKKGRLMADKIASDLFIV
jgi:oxygen-independent coproporphyrinogen-3 oxidase